MFNFVSHYKATTHFSSDELGKNSSTYDMLAIVRNYLTFKSTIRNEKNKTIYTAAYPLLQMNTETIIIKFRFQYLHLCRLCQCTLVGTLHKV